MRIECQKKSKLKCRAIKKRDRETNYLADARKFDDTLILAADLLEVDDAFRLARFLGKSLCMQIFRTMC